MPHKGGKKGTSCSLQLGDMGIGFPESYGRYEKDGKSWSPEVDLNHRFLRGNHDDPKICRNHPNYAGDWKYYEHPDIFVVSGGYSVDHEWRTPNVNWWEDEELSNLQFGQMLRSYKKYRPRIVATHECPTVVKSRVITNMAKLKHTSRTEIALQKMFDAHKPEFWIFGHHHKRLDISDSGVNFVALNEVLYSKSINECIYEIPDIEWG